MSKTVICQHCPMINERSQEMENLKFTSTMLKFLTRDSSNAKVLVDLKRNQIEFMQNQQQRLLIFSILVRKDGPSPLVKKSYCSLSDMYL